MKNKKAIVVTEEMANTFKYAIKDCNTSKYGKPRRIFPDGWTSGPDPVMHDMYYAWSKHRSQANYRNEKHSLSWEDWKSIWANPADFLNRGRKPDNLTLTRIDDDGAWEISNIMVITRLEQLRKARDRVMKARGRL